MVDFTGISAVLKFIFSNYDVPVLYLILQLIRAFPANKPKKNIFLIS